MGVIRTRAQSCFTNISTSTALSMVLMVIPKATFINAVDTLIKKIVTFAIKWTECDGLCLENSPRHKPENGKNLQNVLHSIFILIGPNHVVGCHLTHDLLELTSVFSHCLM